MTQLELFREIWHEREHKSVISGRGLHFDVTCFAHVLSKGAYPALKLVKENIVLMTPDEHYMYDHETHKAKEDPRFNEVFLLAESLKTAYYRARKIINEIKHDN